MILERGNMFDMWGKTDLFLFTSNPIVNKQGLAVMGRGIAKQLADSHPIIREVFGDALSDGIHFPCDWLCTVKGQRVGYFMVKDHWAQPAELRIIRASVDSLIELIADIGMQMEPFTRIDLNFPGIGNGKLKREDVLPLIEKLPDTVHVWEYGE